MAPAPDDDEPLLELASDHAAPTSPSGRLETEPLLELASEQLSRPRPPQGPRWTPPGEPQPRAPQPDPEGWPAPQTANPAPLAPLPEETTRVPVPVGRSAPPGIELDSARPDAPSILPPDPKDPVELGQPRGRPQWKVDRSHARLLHMGGIAGLGVGTVVFLSCMGADPTIALLLGSLMSGFALLFSGLYKVTSGETPIGRGGTTLLRNPEQRPPLDVHRQEMLVQQGRFEEAIASYRMLLEAQPDRVEIYSAIGDLQLDRMNRHEEARATFEAALAVTRDQQLPSEVAGLPDYWRLRLRHLEQRTGREAPPESIEIPGLTGPRD